MNATMLMDLQLGNVKQPGVFIFIDSELTGGNFHFTATVMHWDSRSQRNRRRGREVIFPQDFSVWWMDKESKGWEVLP